MSQTLVVRGSVVELVPYRPEHVAKYHEWMQDPQILAQTKSEPLTLEEEYEMQQSWTQDAQKACFILLDCTAGAEPTMAGDVNLYWNDPDDAGKAEIEVMVAEPSSRRKGIAKEALQLMMQHAMQARSATGFVAKIASSNTPSRCLFEKLGFVHIEDVACFEESHYELSQAATPAAWHHIRACWAHADSQQC